ncbi:GNAT family N-acetyltransferase [Ruminococcus sp. HUN007]|uniref:GNAT family N-acetyltransferase n=1 Tax=Ruminococcus sp. HUN007 TaxID=1514668 RepID=UPI0005D2558F|nr:GNAT family N-acetyltransferase [Ruminococcus sp. HUN007]
MVLDAADIPSDSSSWSRPLPEGLSYTVVNGGDLSDVYEAVMRVEPKWLRFYENNSKSAVIKAVLSGRTVGFAMADTDAGTIITGKDSRTGLLGYVGVVPEERNRGIGLGMVAFAAGYMKSAGCTEVYVNYTSLDEWYAKLGFAENLWYWMGEKKL